MQAGAAVRGAVAWGAVPGGAVAEKQRREEDETGGAGWSSGETETGG